MRLSARGVSFAHPGAGGLVLEDASLHVDRTEAVGLRGPSGIGKSTLARVLAGFLRPQGGSVTVAGRDVTGPCRDVQYLAQDAASAMNPRWRIGRVLDEAGAGDDGDLVEGDWHDRFPHELSGGQLQRVNLARALRARPAFLVADEVTASLDAVTQAQVWRDLGAAARSGGVGLLVVSHDAALLDHVTDRVVEFTPGGPRHAD